MPDDYTPSKKFLMYLDKAEGGVFDRRTGKWMPYRDDSERRLWTSGAGHLIGTGTSGPGEHAMGMTSRKRMELLREDVVRHYNRAKRKIGKEKWNSLDRRRREMLTDIEFNGGVHKYKKFVDAVLKNDTAGMALEHHRFVTKTKTVNGKKKRYRVPLGRNKLFADTFGIPWVDPKEVPELRKMRERAIKSMRQNQQAFPASQQVDFKF